MIQVFALGALFFVQALLIFSLVAFFSGLLNSYISSSSFASYMGKAKAIVFLLIAANLFWV
jgi:threonine/homoserine/homoserine lactone efflux protein